MNKSQHELLDLEFDYESENPIKLDPVITVKLGDQLFALPIESVKEVIKCPEITPLPQLPSHLLGLVNVRGDVVAVTDLSQRFSISSSADKIQFLIILDLEGYSLALGVPNVPDTMQVDLSTLQTTENLGSVESHVEYVKGFLQHQGDIMTLLSIENLLDPQDYLLIR